jgi:FAD/FMN-containing dehydrogenase
MAHPLGQLSARFTGQLVHPPDRAYDDLRRVHNGLIDRRPAIVARCRSAQDVAEIVKFARSAGLEIAVRGGGHGVAGRATCDGGIVIDLSLMKAIVVDAGSRLARVQGGATWGEFDAATGAHHLATTGGVVSSTGVAGLTLGGGLGWLMGVCGLAVDNVRSMQVVTANGHVLNVSPVESPDLFWALRGGGGNFGVVTSFEFALHPIGPKVTGGPVAYPFPAAGDVLRRYREFTAGVPDALTAFAALIHSPDGAARLAAIVACHAGSLSTAEREVAPLRSFGQPVLDGLGPIDYTRMNTLLDAAYPRGALNYWKSTFLAELSDAAIDTMLDCYAKCPSPMSGVLIEHFHGAATRVPVRETACPHRAPGFNLLILGQWSSPADTARCTSWVRETYAAMRPFAGDRRYVNYLDADEGDDPAAAAYAGNYERLRAIKTRYDPMNVFHLNQNIQPS